MSCGKGEGADHSQFSSQSVTWNQPLTGSVIYSTSLSTINLPSHSPRGYVMSLSLFSSLLFSFHHFTCSSKLFIILCWTNRNRLFVQSIICLFSLYKSSRPLIYALIFFSHFSKEIDFPLKYSPNTCVLDAISLFLQGKSSSVNPSL